MKTRQAYCLIVLMLSVMLMTTCADLKIRNLSLSPTCPTTGTEITFRAVVENSGTSSSEPNRLAFKVGGESIPVFYNIPALDPGDRYLVERKLVLDVAQNYQNTVTVDVDDDVSELHEDNNQAEQFYTVKAAPNTTGLTNFEYNEGLATILRGVLIDSAAALDINVEPGYYHIREFRVQGQPDEKVKVINIEKNYGEMAVGQSTLPMRNEPWVFSIIDRDEILPGRQAFSAKDYYGHTFAYKVEKDSTSTCWNVLSVELDCGKVSLSTQTYTTGVLNTCGWGAEPPWTTP